MFQHFVVAFDLQNPYLPEKEALARRWLEQPARPSSHFTREAGKWKKSPTLSLSVFLIFLWAFFSSSHLAKTAPAAGVSRLKKFSQKLDRHQQ